MIMKNNLWMIIYIFVFQHFRSYAMFGFYYYIFQSYKTCIDQINIQRYNIFINYLQSFQPAHFLNSYNKQITMNRKNIQKANSTYDLYTDITQAKDKKKLFLKQLKNDVDKSQSIIKKSQSQAALKIKPNSQKIVNKKQKSLDQLARSLNQRIIVDRETSKKFDSMTTEQLEKKLQIQKRIDEIKKRNQTRVRQLKQFQEKYLKKLNDDYQKDKQKQEKLLMEYQSVMNQQGKIKQTKSYRKAIQNQDWKAILKQKQKIQRMVKDYKRKQQLLLKDQDPEALRKLIQQNQVKIIVQQKQQIIQVRKPRVKADAKQIGNEYLQYAKKLKQMPKQKPKARMLDINLKCIDYQSQIMNKIARNTGDLSKIKMEQAAITTVTGKQGKLGNNSSFKMVNPEIKQDEETKKYLRQIKVNLKQLSKQN